ncbi:MAG: DUF3551 domain-containing protein [Proteobacteria bacterium]|nr:DUF3551 domain-containing protein [Pseudomonadota bacterium]
MRTFLAAALGLIGAATIAATSSPASASVYPWCALYAGAFGGSTNCYFSTIEQCRAAVSGNGGYCERNAFYPAYRDKPNGTSNRG